MCNSIKAWHKSLNGLYLWELRGGNLLFLCLLFLDARSWRCFTLAEISNLKWIILEELNLYRPENCSAWVSFLLQTGNRPVDYNANKFLWKCCLDWKQEVCVNCEFWEVTEINVLNLAVLQWVLPILTAWGELWGVRGKLTLFRHLSPHGQWARTHNISWVLGF